LLAVVGKEGWFASGLDVQLRDAMLLVHARATGVLPEEFRPRIFTSKRPSSMHTFLLDGAVAGAWRCENGRIELEPFRRLRPAERSELEEEGERLAAFHA
jgi:hypothetical protein